MPKRHNPPSTCPTCQGQLAVSGLHCDDCGTEVRGHFRHCDFCALDDAQRDLLRVFLTARGNTKELERHLGVSYPTARARLDDLLAVLGIPVRPVERTEPRTDRRKLLDAVASGKVDVESAMHELSQRRT
ncbi:DUF2089 domain-containing protein [Tenggerimyces flavus]|uniref:DUF2089 domain-containing protein n=1 Tax=Tenggerimyces flavus TaxID=1708749 RepID=A0ABV7YBZ6_9ACTN|nr:DUF2089 domain-containing protein [Tenggerimyces flavus]MBM7783693.1 hypothetical protein [Tenggerimyces flavus]